MAVVHDTEHSSLNNETSIYMSNTENEHLPYNTTTLYWALKTKSIRLRSICHFYGYAHSADGSNYMFSTWQVST